MTDGEAAAGEDEGKDEVVNCEDIEVDEEDLAFDEVVDSVGNGGSEVSTLPTVIVTGIMVPERVSEAGMGMVAVAEARGEENEPDIPSSLSYNVRSGLGQ